MKIGVSVPNIGPVATPEAVKTVAQKAEALGYNSLWTVERLLWPVNPKLPYPVTPDGSLPEEYKYTLDPLDTLTFAAAHTSTIKLGTSVLDMPYYNPVMLARRLSTIDVLSKGRLRVGLGLGWSPDEMEATGADMKVRGARADEFIQVLKAIWTTDPAEYHGKFFSLPKSYIRSQTGTEAASADLHRGVRAAGIEAGSDHGRWMEPDGRSRRRHGADVWGDTADGAGSGTRPGGTEHDRSREPVPHRKTNRERSRFVRGLGRPGSRGHRGLREDRRRRGVSGAGVHPGRTVAEQLGTTTGRISAAGVIDFSPQRHEGHGGFCRQSPTWRRMSRRKPEGNPLCSGKSGAILLDLAPIPADDFADPAACRGSWMSRRLSCDH